MLLKQVPMCLFLASCIAPTMSCHCQMAFERGRSAKKRSGEGDREGRDQGDMCFIISFSLLPPSKSTSYALHIVPHDFCFTICVISISKRLFYQGNACARDTRKIVS